MTTFNVLADGLAQHGDFVNCPADALAWEYRLPRIVQEVAEARPDILALQEANHFEEIAAALAPLGLTGHFLPKRPSPCERFGAPPDGVALFYRPARLTPLEGPRGTPYARPDGGGDMTQGFVAATLRDAATGRAVVVAATHLKAKEGAPNAETRRIQAAQLMRHVSAAAAAAGPGPVGVLVAGDLNDVSGSPACAALRGDAALPLASLWDVPWAAAGGGRPGGETQSGEQQEKRQKGTGKKPGAEGNGSGGSMGGGGGGGPPEFTTWKFRSGGEARRVIDHVFFSPAALAPVSRWRMLSAEEIGAGGLPCARYPSDHVAVTAAFAWLP